MPEQTNQQQVIRATYFSIAGNTCMALFKALAGFLGNSYALIADAIESTADIFSSLLVLAGIRYTHRPADENHPYGHGRAEPLITFIVVGFLITSATVIAYESIQNIRTPHELPAPWTLVVLLIIILWKEFSFRKVMRRAVQTGSTSLKADAWHHRSDAVTSVAAFAGIAVALLLGNGYEAADDWAALFASGFILYNSYKIFRPALGEIMDEHRYQDLQDQIKSVAIQVPGILGTEKCWIRKAGMMYHVDLHARVDGTISVRLGHDLAHRLKDRLKLEIPQLGHILIHVEPDMNSAKE